MGHFRVDSGYNVNIRAIDDFITDKSAEVNDRLRRAADTTRIGNRQ